MQISQDVLNQIAEQKRKVVFLALSTMRIKNGIVEKSILRYDGQDLGAYYHQMEPILLLCNRMGFVPDDIVVLCSAATTTPKNFIIDDTPLEESEEKYFKRRIIEIFGKDLMRPIYEEDADVKTIKRIIDTLREFNHQDNGMRLIIDIHGGLRNTQMLIQSIVSLLRFESIIPEKTYTVQHDPSSNTGEIVTAYDINQFVSGMGEFLSYGRSDSLVEYYDGTDNKLSDLISDISDSIQLCNISRFDEAVGKMKKYVDNYHDSGDYSDLFIDVIKSSYGKLMDENGHNRVINKVQWCVEKDFIQQALTIIESQMPAELLNNNVIAYRYENPPGEVFSLYHQDGRNETLIATGDTIRLSEALDYAKPEWESQINYSLIPWIRENCCDKQIERGRTTYIFRLNISGNSEDSYLFCPIEDDCLKNECIIRRVNQKKDSIKLGFTPNPELDLKQKKDLCRLLMLHLALKEQRNSSNHASSIDRCSVNEVKAAIKAYITLTESVFRALGR